MKVRDKLWMFACRAHENDTFLGKREHFFEEGVIKYSRITPAEGAFMLDIPNILMVCADGVPIPFSDDAYGYAESFCRMDRVVWSSVGSGGFRTGNEEAFICELAKRYHNIHGALLDDFLIRYPATDEGRESMKADLATIRQKLSGAPHPMELWVTLYTHQFGTLVPAFFDDIDTITLWTWNHEDLVDLKSNFEWLENKLPKQKKMLGIYLYDYPSGHILTNEEMELQCEYGLKLLKEGRIDGMIFCANCVMGVQLESEYWLRNWIAQVKNIDL